MQKRTHVLGGLVFGTLAIKLGGAERIVADLPHSENFVNLIGSEMDVLSSLGSWGVFLFACLFGSVFLDIDHPNSFIGRRMKVTSFVVHHTLGHRGFTHSLLFVFGASFFSYLLLLIVFSHVGSFLFVAHSFSFGFFLGMVSHLLLDMMTKSGVPLLHPFSKKRYSISPIKTGSVGESLFALVLLGIQGGLMFF